MSTLTKHRFTVDDVYLMVDHGILPSDQRIELINGEIIDMSPINLPHANSVTKLDRFFSRHLSQEDYIIRVQNPVLLSDYSLPEPDLVVAHYRDALLKDEHTRPNDVVLLIEVADTTSPLRPTYQSTAVRCRRCSGLLDRQPEQAAG